MQKKSAKLLVPAMIILLLAAFTAGSASAKGQEEGKKTGDDKVAVVNGVVISRADYDLEFGSVIARYSASGQQLKEEDMSKLRKDVLENIINGELLFQASQKEGIKMDKEAVDDQLATIKKRFSSEEEFKSELAKINRTEDQVRHEIQRGIVIQQLIKEKIAKDITITDEESKSFYDGNTESFKQPEQIRVSHILISVDPKDDEAKKKEARQKIEEIEKKVKEGGEFSTLAKENSSCPSSANGGDLGFFGRGQMVKPFEDAAFALKPGEVSGVVETDFGFHLIKFTEKKDATTVPFEDIKDRIAQHLEKEKMQKAVDTYLDKLKESAKIERFNDV